MRFVGNEPVLWTLFYGVVIALLFPVINLYRDTPVGIVAVAALWFVFLVPVFLLAMIRYSSSQRPFGLFKWHLVACVCILVLSVVTLLLHWLRGMGGGAS